ncbi:DNA-binding IclR family transcriptional regulator [Spinactinospora alkalitolerans]|uniref:DNA-binding IclR family transcriptional regulator n=1 Tax=Spinactinospora alkalitolerans TaxID=687207 RepID=A0A852TVN9_9ACTN|nr:IclR family transcriptional regulator [Spinactinospora alkalitolerans]NYE47771.1 DNA-binding IclR family transcriptional regulator [Spinactinospora alkalitolerans]
MARRTPALLRGLDILELFTDGRESISAPEVVEELGLPRTTAHELLHTLVDRRYLRQSEVPGRYQLGLQLFRLGSAYAERLDTAKVGHQVAQELVKACNETVHVAVLDHVHVVYIAKVESSHAVRMVSALGARVPAHCTALGKALLSALPERELRDRFGDAPLEAMTSRSITGLPRLLEELEGVRASGTAVEICESNPDVCCVAAPVRDRTDQVVAALSISVPLHRWSDALRGELEELVADGARRFSSALGWRSRG